MDVYGIIGDPVEHALSPVIHRAAFAELGLEAAFHRFPVAEGDVADAVRGAGTLGMAGLVATMPHKETVAGLDCLDTEGTAARIGAANTIDLRERRAINTDGAGAARALVEAGVSLPGTRVLVLGAGGAGKPIAYELADRGATVDVANIERGPAEAVVDLIREDGGTASAHGLDAIPELLAEASVLVDATSVGMDEDESLVDPADLRTDLVVFDVVHTPLETRLLRDAAAVGATTIDGASLLLLQGVEAFEQWTGREAPVEVMETALRTHLAERGDP